MMAHIDLEAAVQLREGMLLEDDPGLGIEHSMQGDGWALLTIQKGGKLVGFEFLETEGSWGRPDALLQYREPVEDGFYVGIVVPATDLDKLSQELLDAGGQTVTILSYEEAGIRDLVLG